MPEPTDDPALRPIQTDHQTFSPSPIPGQPPPQRRAEDLKSYAGEWTALITGLLIWATTFSADAAKVATWREMTTPAFVFIHAGQLFGVLLALVSAKKLK